jgi:beta-lactamase superfamily II metal-dependent hydrolase
MLADHSRAKKVVASMNRLVAHCIALLAIAWASSASPGAYQPVRADELASECKAENPLVLHVYDVGQAAAALVELPDGRTILVDAGASHTALEPRLEKHLRGRPLSLVWITHPHDDHLNQLKAILRHVKVENYVDNGFEGGSRSRSAVGGMGSRMRDAAAGAGANVVSADNGDVVVPIGNTPSVTLTPIAPRVWPPSCSSTDANNCSLGLRIDYCKSSILFLGDAGPEETGQLPLQSVTLLYVPHHGSRGSTSASLLKATRPKYAVISAGRDSKYCHPSSEVVDRLNSALGGARTGAATVSDRGSGGCDWHVTARSDRLWITSTDGDITLVTLGDGDFRREMGGHK